MPKVKATKEKTYSLRANVDPKVKTTITKVQGKLMLKGESHNVEDAINYICAEFDKSLS